MKSGKPVATQSRLSLRAATFKFVAVWIRVTFHECIADRLVIAMMSPVAACERPPSAVETAPTAAVVHVANFTGASLSQPADCQLTFKGPSGAGYDRSHLIQFVGEQVRPRLSQAAGSFVISLSKNCSGNAQSVSVTIDGVDYYITDIGSHHLSKEESTYVTSALSLSAGSLETAIDGAARIDALTTQQIQDVVKTLAFFFAETARFSDVENTVGILLSRPCTAQWLDYATLLRRWSVLSHFALYKGANDWTVQGGSSNRLVAPITSAEVAKYDLAISQGPGGPDAHYVDSRDWGTPIKLAAPACATQ